MADPTGRAGEIVAALLEVSPEFAARWRLHEVDVTHHLELLSATVYSQP